MSKSSGDMKSLNGTPIVLEYFSTTKVDLMLEVNKHPQLCGYLAGHNQTTEWGEIIGEIAAFVNMAMDGGYTTADLEFIHLDLIRRLRNKRSVIQTLPIGNAASTVH